MKRTAEWKNPSPKRTRRDEDEDDDASAADDSAELPVTLENVLAASKRIEGKVVKTPCTRSRKLSKALGMNIFMKNDYLQITGSFKERGALNSLLQLSAKARKKGVIAASAGNHALALAYHGTRLSIPVTVCMPTTAPLTKVQNCREFGAEVIVSGTNFTETMALALRLAEERGLTYVHGFNATSVIAGQGSVGLEILEQVPNVDAIIVPVGGAGLIAGVALAVKTQKPDVQVIGVEPLNYPSLVEALEKGEVVEIPGASTIADGLAVKAIGKNTLPICQRYVDKVVTVSEHYIALAILRLVEMEKAVVEGAAAAALAPLLAGQLPELRGKNVVIVLCGGNIDVTLIGRVLDYALAADGRLVRFQSMISDRPGGLASFARLLADEQASIKEIVHERIFPGDEFSNVHVTVTVETRDREHWDRVYQRLLEAKIPTTLRLFPVAEPNGESSPSTSCASSTFIPAAHVDHDESSASTSS